MLLDVRDKSNIDYKTITIMLIVCTIMKSEIKYNIESFLSNYSDGWSRELYDDDNVTFLLII